MLISLSSAHVVHPKYGVYAHRNCRDIFSMTSYPKSHSAWYLHVLLAAEAQRAELFPMPKAKFASKANFASTRINAALLPISYVFALCWEFSCFPVVAQNSPAVSGALNCSRTGDANSFLFPQGLLLLTANGDHFESIPPKKKSSFTTKTYWGLITVALWLISIKESEATDEPGWNKWFAKATQ